ncbi:MAG: polysaccharide deacetylase family protein [Burkholderiales bacterium]|nr:polysaccharide deacetylase family protein [Burkholderiales bacterium]
MARSFKRRFLILCRTLGLFRLTRRLVARRLLILCYHGFCAGDEARFRPKLFMAAETFAGRMDVLKTSGSPILELEEALRRLSAGTLPPNAVVVTIDDGFHGVYDRALPVLEQRGIPATVYVTSYHVLKQTPVFRLVVQYMFWRTRTATLDCTDWRWLDDSGKIALEPAKRNAVAMRVVAHGEALATEAEREALLCRLGEKLAVDYEELKHRRVFTLMSQDELARAVTRGLDIQLHTHRHRFPPDDPVACAREILDNRSALEPSLAYSPTHFCYPSGVWREQHWTTLEATGVRSAVTCDPGFNDASTPRFALKRFLDGEDVSAIEFEAEVSGFTQLLRALLRR